MRAARRTLLLLLAIAAGHLSDAGSARADLAEDAASRASFWSPDGWKATSQRRGAWTVLLRRAPDDKAMCGLAVSRSEGTLVATLESVEAIWKQGPETYERLSKTDGLVGGSAGLRVEHRITADGRSLRAFSAVAAAGEWRCVIWAAYEAGLDASYGPVARRVLDSLVLPRPAPAPPAPSVPVEHVPPTSGAPQGVGLLVDPRFREGRPFDVLLAGDAPLLRGTVDAFVDLLEASTGSVLPEREEQALRDEIEAAWPKAGAEDRALLDAAVARRERARTALRSGDAASAREAVAAFTADLAVRTSARPGGAWQEIARRAATRGRERFATSGEPPVSVAAIDAYEELLLFVTSLARNDGSRVTEGQRAAVRAERLRAAVDAATSEARRRLAASPRLWSYVKAAWDGASPDVRLRVRWAAVDLVRRVAGLPDVPADVRADGLAGYARAATGAAEALPVFDAYTNVVANGPVAVVALLEALGVAAGDVERVYATDPLTLR